VDRLGGGLRMEWSLRRLKVGVQQRNKTDVFSENLCIEAVLPIAEPAADYASWTVRLVCSIT
jgi:hypothetical protein